MLKRALPAIARASVAAGVPPASHPPKGRLPCARVIASLIERPNLSHRRWYSGLRERASVDT
jgi:hypothetical protein